jgi:type IV pilus assembly protein PilB
LLVNIPRLITAYYAMVPDPAVPVQRVAFGTSGHRGGAFAASFNVASSVLLITAQRLGRKLCTHCKKPKDIPPEALIQAGFKEDELDGAWQPFGPVGCDQCKGTGYKGRVGVYQVMPITDDMRLLIMRNGNAYDIAEQAKKEGVRDLRQSGLIKVKQGIMSLEEVEAITNE